MNPTYLLIDNSNTRTKFVLSTPDQLSGERVIIPTKELNNTTLAEGLSGFHYDFVVISSVVPRVRELLQENLHGPVHLLTASSILNVGVSYPNPRQIGADRLANAVGAVDRYGFPCIVVDFGTAVTFDVIGPKPDYLGGVIAPGLASMGEYLAANTALLPSIQPHEPAHAIGKSTEEAMQAGAVYGYRGMVKEILSKLKEELPSSPAIIATGGDAALIAKGVPEIRLVDQDITLNGLRIVANLNFN